MTEPFQFSDEILDFFNPEKGQTTREEVEKILKVIQLALKSKEEGDDQKPMPLTRAQLSATQAEMLAEYNALAGRSQGVLLKALEETAEARVQKTRARWEAAEKERDEMAFRFAFAIVGTLIATEYIKVTTHEWHETVDNTVYLVSEVLKEHLDVRLDLADSDE